MIWAGSKEDAEIAAMLVVEYYNIQKAIRELSNAISNSHSDTKMREGRYLSNHLIDYFEECKGVNVEERITFEAYSRELDIPVCQACEHLLELILQRKELRKKLGYVRIRIMRLGKKTAHDVLPF